MILYYEDIIDEVREYIDQAGKIRREVEKGNLIKLKRGLYENDPNTNPVTLAKHIYGPSYVSFQWALSYYSLIPEKVVEITSATTGKSKRKKFNNDFGRFSYRDVPKEAFGVDVVTLEEGGGSLDIATPEKAILDTIYTIPSYRSLKWIEYLMFEDLRINELYFDRLDKKKMVKLAGLYGRGNPTLLARYLVREGVA